MLDEDPNNTTVSFGLIKKLMVVYPRSVPDKDDEFEILAIAIGFDYSDQVFDFILSKTPENKNVLQIGWKGKTTIITEQMSRRIAKVISLLQIRHLRCSPCRWTLDGFVTLMQALMVNKSVISLHLMLPREVVFSNQLAQTYLKDCLVVNHSLKRLALDGNAESSSRDADDTGAIKTVLDGLQSRISSNLTAFAMSRFSLSNTSLFNKIILNAPQSLILRNITFMGQSTDQKVSADSDIKQSKLN